MNRLFLTIFIALIFLSGCNKEDNNISKGKWEKQNDFPGEGSYPSASFVIDGKEYVATVGYHQSGFYAFDPITNSWFQKASLPVFIRSSAGFAINGKGYLMTGTDTNDNALQEVWEYDPLNDTWIRKKDFPGLGRYDAAAFAIGGKGYLGTGLRDITSGNVQLSDWWQYDPVTDAWTQKKDFPGGPCNLAVATAAGTKGFMGVAGPGLNPGKQWWAYDPASDAWTRKADFQGKQRYGASIFVIDNFCYVGNGGIGAGNNPSTFLYDWWKYDIASDKWIEVAPQTNERYVGAGFAINGFGYLGLGGNNASPDLLKDFWRFDPR